jgi:branched-chain amino acid transport system substrate-binding protein
MFFLLIHKIFLIFVLLFSFSAAQAQSLVGIAAPLEGPFAPLGSSIKTGFEKAFEQAAELSGGAGLLSEDDGCSAEGGRRAAERLVQAGARIVIGHPCWRAALAASDIYADADVIMIGVGAREPVLTTERAGQTIFRLAGRQDRQASFLVDQIQALTQAEDAILVLHDGELYARSLIEPFHTILESGIKRDVTTINVDETPLELAAISNIFDGSDYKLIVILAGQASSASILQKVSGHIGDTQVLGPDSFGHPDFYASIQDLEMKLFFAFQPVYPILLDEKQRDFIAEAKTWYGLEWLGYAAGQIVLNLLPIERPDDRLTVLSTGTFDTVLGPISFSDNGDANIDPFLLYQWSDNGMTLHNPDQSDKS